MKAPTETRALWISIGATCALVAIAIGVYTWLALEKWEKAPNFGALGDAIGPFAGLATALALGAAIYSTMLQREELKLQREEMRAQREEMAAQRAEAAKAADAQERLAAAQEELAQAQNRANEIARGAVQAQRRATIATCFSTLALVDAQEAIARPDTIRFGSWGQEKHALRAIIDAESARLEGHE